MTDTKTCRDCGAEFKKSRTDSTVRCPDCRASARNRRNTSAYTAQDEADAYLARCEAQIAAMRARDDEDKARRYFAANDRYEMIRKARQS